MGAPKPRLRWLKIEKSSYSTLQKNDRIEIMVYFMLITKKNVKKRGNERAVWNNYRRFAGQGSYTSHVTGGATG